MEEKKETKKKKIKGSKTRIVGKIIAAIMAILMEWMPVSMLIFTTVIYYIINA